MFKAEPVTIIHCYTGSNVKFHALHGVWLKEATLFHSTSTAEFDTLSDVMASTSVSLCLCCGQKHSKGWKLVASWNPFTRNMLDPLGECGFGDLAKDVE